MRALLLALVLASPLVLAKHAPVGVCDGQGSPALDILRVGTRDSPRTFYLDDRGQHPTEGNGLWVYEETNGIDDGTAAHGLQRGGGPLLWGDAGAQSQTDVCTDDPLVTPDTMWL